MLSIVIFFVLIQKVQNLFSNGFLFLLLSRKINKKVEINLRLWQIFVKENFATELAVVISL